MASFYTETASTVIAIIACMTVLTPPDVLLLLSSETDADGDADSSDDVAEGLAEAEVSAAGEAEDSSGDVDDSFFDDLMAEDDDGNAIDPDA